MSRKTNIAALLLTLGTATSLLACLWDSDTLQMERLRFPGVLEIITGKFVRHSPAYYEWRIGDRKKKLETKPNDPALIDDLAVAYAKLGRPAEGIPLLEEVLKQHPDRYETLSNLGTLLFFANRLDDSKAYIRRALEINPDAHFGREKYQLLLTEYLQQSEKSKAGVMSEEKRFSSHSPIGFANYVLKSTFPTLQEEDGGHEVTNEEKAELAKAVRGLLGMLHFADYHSPILLEALGDLLITGDLQENAGQLAALTFLRAGQTTVDASLNSKFKTMAKHALAGSSEFHNVPEEKVIAILQSKLAPSLAAAETAFTQIEIDERQWIRENVDVDAAFAAKYYDSLEATVTTAKKAVRSEPYERPVEIFPSPKRIIWNFRYRSRCIVFNSRHRRGCSNSMVAATSRRFRDTYQ